MFTDFSAKIILIHILGSTSSLAISSLPKKYRTCSKGDNALIHKTAITIFWISENPYANVSKKTTHLE
ncbi:hypothetical protein M758_3G021000 [Ceratodon purpureus]|nr:hypothetical protein M758_3G021000 [Ceratodon purpureus]